MAKGSLGGINLNDTIRLPDPKNKRVGKHRAQLSFTGTELCRFEVPIGCNANVPIFFLKLGDKKG